MIVLITAAGMGRRFKAEGYLKPKPFINIMPSGHNSLSMLNQVIYIAKKFPEVSRIIVGLEESMKDCIPEIVSDVEVVLVKFTEGQSITTKNILVQFQMNINLEEDILILPCDSIFDLKNIPFKDLIFNADAVVFLDSVNKETIENPHNYGWVIFNRDRVYKVGVKKRVFDTFDNTGIVSGIFWFRRVDTLIENIDAQINSNIKVNNEFYLDSVIEVYMLDDANVKGIRLPFFQSLGNPELLRIFQQNYSYFYDFSMYLCKFYGK